MRGIAFHAGATLLELVVVLTLIAILAAIGVPTYRYITTASRMSAELNDLVGDMQYARSEAVREGRTVTVCIAASVTQPYSCAGPGTTSWQDGWLVFTDLQADQTIDPGDTVLRVQQPFAHGDTLTSDNNISSVTFNRDGFAWTNYATVTITLKDSTDNSAFTRCLYISMSGMMNTVMHTTDPNCT